MKKQCVVNFASGAWYPKGQVRLRTSLIKNGYDGDFILCQNPKNINSPTHQEVPYAFKTHLLMEALRLGYEQVIFADSSIYAVKSWKPIWNLIASQGYFIEAAGHWTGTWTKDSVLNRMGYTRDEAMEVPMYSAGFTGLNFKDETALKFLHEWHKYACDGDSFKGTWGNENGQMSKDPRCKGHRHDMSVASLLANKYKMKISTGGTYLAYIGNAYGTPKESVVAHLQPCK